MDTKWESYQQDSFDKALDETAKSKQKDVKLAPKQAPKIGSKNKKRKKR